MLLTWCIVGNLAETDWNLMKTTVQDGGRSGVVDVLTCLTSRVFQISLSNVTLLKVGTSLKLKFCIFLTP